MSMSGKIPLTIPTIDCARHDAVRLLDELRRKLSPRGDIVSESGKQRTVELFGEPLTPQQVVERICRDVERDGLKAVLDYTARLDGRQLTDQTLRVSPLELEAAHQQADPQYLATLRRIMGNITAFQSSLLPHDTLLQKDIPEGGRIELRQRYLPLKRIGICVPGGAAAYPSTLLMTAVPAQVAGVREIAVIVPPTAFGGYNTDLLAACRELGITEIYRIGGAQGVAALAYGVEGIAKVDKIVGPGNLFVALAKQFVFGDVDIDSIAGPSEVVVLADETARPEFIASDLISQAEHSPGSGVLITWHAPLIEEVQSALEAQLAAVDRGNLARASLEQYGALVLARDAEEAARLSDLLAPEHLHISTADPEAMLARVQNAGAIFLGHYTPVALGDYVAGPSHVLPTGGTARFANGLCAIDFLKRSSVIAYDEPALRAAAGDVRLMAAKEGLTAHSASIDVRLR
ncbi:MAG TPA: histidinol dehydrogenase [Planctomycetaceae bacterium]|nr:histidinol dehydrogenase [Planctomycetaceae bacterium]